VTVRAVKRESDDEAFHPKDLGWNTNKRHFVLENFGGKFSTVFLAGNSQLFFANKLLNY